LSLRDDVDNNHAFEALRLHILKGFDLPVATTVHLKYKDSDGDLCTLAPATMEDALEAETLLRITVCPLQAQCSETKGQGTFDCPNTEAHESENSADDRCSEGGWGDDESDDEYALVNSSFENGGQLEFSLHELQVQTLASQSPEIQMNGECQVSDYRLWVEDMAFQVGNSAHEVRNALRFWSSLVKPVSGHTPSDALRHFKRADNLSGKLEAKMRRLVDRMRSKRLGKYEKPLSKLLPKGQVLLNDIWANLSVFDAKPHAAAEQRATVEKLVMRQAAILDMLAAVSAQGHQSASFPIPPGCRVDFGMWGSHEQQQIQKPLHKLVLGQNLTAEEVIGLARLSCNCSHELQNLSVTPAGGKCPAQKIMKSIDNIAGKCENASRAIMVLIHKWQINRKPGPLARIACRAQFLMESQERCNRLIHQAVSTIGGEKVPVSSYTLSLQRLHLLACVISQAHLSSQERH
jgi:hypothetical protein